LLDYLDLQVVTIRPTGYCKK